MDEFEYFKISVGVLKNNYNNIYEQWFNTLSDSDKDIFNELLHTERIQISNEGNKNIKSIPRRILKIKKTQEIEMEN